MAGAVLSGCPGGPPPPPPPRDAGPVLPDGGSEPADSDGDGVCDMTESVWGTDPLAPDTDLDGFNDRVELDFGFSPLQTDSPARDLLVFMQETEGSTLQVPIELIVRGGGETYSGGFEAEPVPGLIDYTAATFLESAHAIGALPMENVFEVQSAEQRFVSVIGRTQLVFEIRFAFGTALPRSCATAFPFRYQVKRGDGVLVAYRRHLLVLLPRGERLDTAQWCVPVGGCI